MSEVLVQEPPVAARHRPWLGSIGVVMAFLALGLAVSTPAIVQAVQPPRKDLQGAIADAGGKLIDRLKGVKPPPPQPAFPWEAVLSTTTTGLGLLGALAGTAGWIRREDGRLAVTALVVGCLAVAWSYVLLGIVVGVGLCILWMLLDLEPG